MSGPSYKVVRSDATAFAHSMQKGDSATASKQTELIHTRQRSQSLALAARPVLQVAAVSKVTDAQLKQRIKGLKTVDLSINLSQLQPQESIDGLRSPVFTKRSGRESKSEKKDKQLEVRTYSLVNCKDHYKDLIKEYKSRSEDKKSLLSQRQPESGEPQPSTETRSPLMPIPTSSSDEKERHKSKTYTHFKNILEIAKVPDYYDPATDDSLKIEKKSESHNTKLSKYLIKQMKDDPLFTAVTLADIGSLAARLQQEEPVNAALFIKKSGAILEPIILCLQSLQRKLYILFRHRKKCQRPTVCKRDSDESKDEESGPKRVTKTTSTFAVALYSRVKELVQLTAIDDLILHIDQGKDLKDFLEKIDRLRKSRGNYELWKVIRHCFGADEKGVDNVIELLKRFADEQG